MERRIFLKTLGAVAMGALARAGLAAPFIPPDPRFNAVSKLLWVWQTTLLDSAAVIGLMKEYGFDTVLFSIAPGERQLLFSEGANGTLTRHLREFRDRGIAFYAVSGDPTWCRNAAADPGFVPGAVTELVIYQQKTGLLDGLCFDIEPEALPEWSRCTGEGCLADPAFIGMLKGYLTLLRNLGAAYELTRDSRNFSRPLMVVLSPGFVNKPDPYGEAKDLLVAAADRLRSGRQRGIPVLLAYRSLPSLALDYAQPAIDELAERGHRNWWFGQTVYPNPQPGISYAAGTFTNFEGEMVRLDRELSDAYGTAYAGIAVNDYQSLIALLKARP